MSVGVAVVGAGYWGKNLARNFYELGALKSICDTNDLLEENYKNKYPDINFTTSYDRILQDPSIEAVAIATPAETHFILVMEMLKAGKHVFVEKPLALTINDGKQLVALSKQQSRTLMVGHILQYHNAIIKLKELIDSGELGKLQYLCSNRLNMGKIRTEENILWSFAPHDISVILMLLNEEPHTVYATGGEYLQKKVADVTLTIMDFPSGVKAHIFVSWLHPFKEQKLIVVGDKKMAVFDDLCENKLSIYPHKVEWVQRTPVVNKAEAEIIPLGMTEPLKAECQHFLECITTGIIPKTDGAEGLRVLRVLDASQMSLDEKRIISTVISPPSASTDESLSRNNEQSGYFIHETSYIDNDVTIGSGTKIWHFSHILKNSIIGSNCNIGQNVVIGPNVTIGKGCKIQNNVSVYEGVVLEDEVFCGPSMVFTNIFNPRSHIPRMHELKSTRVKRGATIGANATIVCGHTIGQYAFIAAGTVVTKDVPDYALVTGNPGRIKGWMCECGIKLSFTPLQKPGEQTSDSEQAHCKQCGLDYLKRGNGVIKQP